MAIMPTGNKLVALPDVSTVLAPLFSCTAPVAAFSAWAIHFFLPDLILSATKCVCTTLWASRSVKIWSVFPLVMCTLMPNLATFWAMVDLVIIPPLPNCDLPVQINELRSVNVPFTCSITFESGNLGSPS